MRPRFGVRLVRSCSHYSASTAANRGKDEGCVEPGCVATTTIESGLFKLRQDTCFSSANVGSYQEHQKISDSLYQYAVATDDEFQKSSTLEGPSVDMLYASSAACSVKYQAMNAS
jgi:hypothetical protein